MSRGYRAVLHRARLAGLRAPIASTRRDFLRRSAQVAAALAVAPAVGSIIGCRNEQRGDARTGGDDDAIAAPGGNARGLRVCVVGAGFAGLACADALTRAGADVTVLEASDRAGGRVLSNSQFIPNTTIEMGGEYVGENHPTWLAYAERFDLPLEEVPEYDGEEPIILDGQLITGDAAIKLAEEVESAIAKLVEMAGAIEDPVRPWSAPNASELDERSMAQFIGEQNLSALAQKYMRTAEEADNGVPIEQMSLLAYLSMIKGGGLGDYYELSETHRVNGGNDLLAEALVKALNKPVVFRSPVVRIARTPQGATVFTEAGREVQADAVVLAIPPTQWGKIDMGIPVEQVPQMGKNIKCILRLSRPVWKGGGLTPEATTNGSAQLSWVPGQGAKDDGVTGLTLYAGADTAERWRTMPQADRPREGIATLAPAFPELSDATQASMFVDWVAMPRYQASYSFPAPGQVTRMGPTLVDGVADDLAPLMFAGEHTSFAFTGYMEGALSSGIRVARQLVARRARA
jgi:monoamine oxidase